MTAEYGTYGGEGFTVRDLPKPPRTRQHAPWYQPTYPVVRHRLDDCHDLLSDVKARLIAERDEARAKEGDSGL